MMCQSDLQASTKICAEIFANRGLAVRIAEACGIHRAAVYQWKQVPPRRLQAVAAVTGWRPETIRPDLYKHKPGKRSVSDRLIENRQVMIAELRRENTADAKAVKRRIEARQADIRKLTREIDDLLSGRKLSDAVEERRP